LVAAMMMAASTQTTIATCVQIQNGDTVSPSGAD
jgi:hypothetical protein